MLALRNFRPPIPALPTKRPLSEAKIVLEKKELQRPFKIFADHSTGTSVSSQKVNSKPVTPPDTQFRSFIRFIEDKPKLETQKQIWQARLNLINPDPYNLGDVNRNSPQENVATTIAFTPSPTLSDSNM